MELTEIHKSSPFKFSFLKNQDAQHRDNKRYIPNLRLNPTTPAYLQQMIPNLTYLYRCCIKSIQVRER